MKIIDGDHLKSILQEYIKREKSYVELGEFPTKLIASCVIFGLEEAIAQIDSEPSAQPELHWIPCSEETGDGYPEKDGFYYVTEQNYGFYLDADYKQRVTHTSHFKNGDFTDRFYTENSSNITAWMQLPEPYKGEQE